MGRKKPDDRAAAASGGSPLVSNPFAALSGLRDGLPEGESPPAEVAPSPTAAPAGPRRAVVSYQRKGRGGKEVTCVSKLELAAADLDRWCQKLKRALGCGGFVEADAIVLAGDQRARLPALLEARGVVRVTVG